MRRALAELGYIRVRMEGQACRNLNFLHSFIMGPLPISWSLCSWEVLELRVYRSRQQEMFCTSHSGTPRIYEGPQLLCRAAHVRGLGHCWEMMWCVLRQLNSCVRGAQGGVLPHEGPPSTSPTTSTQVCPVHTPSTLQAGSFGSVLREGCRPSKVMST